MYLQGVQSLLTDLVLDLTMHPCVTAGTDAFVAGHSKGFKSLKDMVAALPSALLSMMWGSLISVKDRQYLMQQAFTPCMHAFIEDAHHWMKQSPDIDKTLRPFSNPAAYVTLLSRKQDPSTPACPPPAQMHHAALLQVNVILHVDQCVLPDAVLDLCNGSQQHRPDRGLSKMQRFQACKAWC